MSETILVVNAGSSSIKFQLFAIGNNEQLERRLKGQIEGVGTQPRLVAKDTTGKTLIDERWPAAEVATVPAALETLYSDPQALQRCVDALSGVAGTVPVAVDFGRYTDRPAHRVNQPAIAVLLRGPVGKVDAFIVGPACATAPDNNLYLFKRVAAPDG